LVETWRCPYPLDLTNGYIRISLIEDCVGDDFIVDVHMTDPNSPSLKEHIRLFELLKNSPELLNEYEILKVKSNGINYREYQRKKYEFYNRVLGINQK